LYIHDIDVPLKVLKRVALMAYPTSSCSIRTKKRAKQSPGKNNATTGVRIGGKKDAVMNLIV